MYGLARVEARPAAFGAASGIGASEAFVVLKAATKEHSQLGEADSPLLSSADAQPQLVRHALPPLCCQDGARLGSSTGTTCIPAMGEPSSIFWEVICGVPAVTAEWSPATTRSLRHREGGSLRGGGRALGAMRDGRLRAGRRARVCPPYSNGQGRRQAPAERDGLAGKGVPALRQRPGQEAKLLPNDLTAGGQARRMSFGSSRRIPP